MDEKVMCDGQGALAEVNEETGGPVAQELFDAEPGEAEEETGGSVDEVRVRFARTSSICLQDLPDAEPDDTDEETGLLQRGVGGCGSLVLPSSGLSEESTVLSSADSRCGRLDRGTVPPTRIAVGGGRRRVLQAVRA
eukprot:m.155445 g.155445  ORF g.155445 m.155445 type:complete len:137 (+) comp14406_c0_seq4:85-495(+)